MTANDLVQLKTQSATPILLSHNFTSFSSKSEVFSFRGKYNTVNTNSINIVITIHDNRNTEEDNIAKTPGGRETGNEFKQQSPGEQLYQAPRPGFPPLIAHYQWLEMSPPVPYRGYRRPHSRQKRWKSNLLVSFSDVIWIVTQRSSEKTFSRGRRVKSYLVCVEIH